MRCIFCRIINKEISSEIIYENERIIVFKDIEPKAKIHLLVVPKKHISSINHLESIDKKLIGELFLISQKIAKEQGIAKSGYRVNCNVGRDAGQTINHLHFHLMGGEKLCH